MESKDLIYDIGISIVIKTNSNIFIDGVHFDDMSATIKFMGKKVQLKDRDDSIVVLIDHNEVSKNNFYTSIKKQDIHAIWHKDENLWQKWQEEEKKVQPKKTFFDTIIEFAKKI